MTKRSLLLKIRKNFPELKWVKAEHNVEGWDHYVLILDNKYVFRFPRTKQYIERLENEISLLNYLKNKVKLRLPNYTYIARDKSFAGYQLIQGEQLKKKVFKMVAEKDRKKLARQIADFLSVLHKIPMLVAQKHSTKKINPTKSYRNLEAEVKKYILPRFNKRDNLLTEEFFKQLKTTLKFPNRVFTHNDFYSSHILVNKDLDKIIGVIDFADRRIDDPAKDFTELYSYGETFVKEVYKHYKGPKDKEFLSRAYVYYKRIPFMEMISRFQGGRGSFREGYRLFKYRFLTQGIFN